MSNSYSVKYDAVVETMSMPIDGRKQGQSDLTIAIAQREMQGWSGTLAGWNSGFPRYRNDG